MLEADWLPTTNAPRTRAVLPDLALKDLQGVAESQDQGDAVTRHLTPQEAVSGRSS